MRLDMRKLTRLRVAAAEGLGYEVAQVGAELLKEDIRAHWSPSSPSSEGRPPAIDSGLLDASIDIEKNYAEKAYRVVVKATTSYPSGTPVRKVADYLEYGTSRMEPRPFFAPAAERAKQDYPQLAEQRMKLFISKVIGS